MNDRAIVQSRNSTFIISSCILSFSFTIKAAAIKWAPMYQLTKTIVAENRKLLMVSLVALLAFWSVLFGFRPMENTSGGVMVWWTALCGVSVVNLCGWRVSAAALARQKTAVEPEVYRHQQWLLLLSAVYVLGCGFRSILPRADVQRIGLVDSWLSSVLVGRSVATVAELCFVLQWALLLRGMARDAGATFGMVIARLLVPLIVVAEICSWYAVLTTCYLGNAIEETLWAVTAVLVIVSCLALWSRCHRAHRRWLAAAVVLGLAYVVFMATVDIPMYVLRWQADEASGREYLTLAHGFKDVWLRRSVTFAWDEWRTEIPWMSLYFSVAVWCSIALVHVPRFGSKPRL
jgi:hypothetical protein